jgi:tripartite-type tricarboxylate transporter receptor subunit TctC
MAQSNPDQLTLLFASNANLVFNPLFDKNDLKAGVDYEPVGISVRVNLVLVTNPSAPFRDIKGVIDFAKANPGKLTCSMVGVGSSTHLALELFKFGAGLDILGVPYKGEAASIPDLLSGRVDLSFLSSTAKPYVEAKQAIGLATTGPQRWDIFPNLPTMQEAGLKDFDVSLYFGVIAPRGTPPEMIQKLHHAFDQAMKDPKVLEVVGIQGLVASPTNSDQFAQSVRDDLIRWKPIFEKAGLKKE